MRKQEKAGVVSGLQEKLSSHAYLILTDYRGMTVKDLAEFRKMLARFGATMQVVKNTLLQRSLSPEQQATAIRDSQLSRVKSCRLAPSTVIRPLSGS